MIDNLTLKSVVASEFRSMLSRRLDFTPNPTELTRTVDVWVQDLQSIGMTDTDASRLRYAFRRAGPNLTKWPTPKVIIDYLPKKQAEQLPQNCSWRTGNHYCQMPGTRSSGTHGDARWYCAWHDLALHSPRSANDLDEFLKWHARQREQIWNNPMRQKLKARNLYVPPAVWDDDPSVIWYRLTGMSMGGALEEVSHANAAV